MNIVILAAGQGKRMNSSLPKVLHPIANKPMLGHVLETTIQVIQNVQPCVVVGHGGQEVEQYLSKAFPQVKIATQYEQKGTGHAVMQAMPAVANSGPTTILYGDVPLIQAKSLNKIAELALGGALVILTQLLDDPTGYGRIMRNLDGDVVGIVEEKDATMEQRKIQEINTGILCCDTQDLKRWLEKLTPNNAQGEFYLTDIIAFAANEGVPIRTIQPEYSWEVQGVNSRLQLAALEREYQAHLANQLLINGVTLSDPARIDIRGTLTCKTDVSIDVGCIFEGDVQIASKVEIGPYCVIKNSSIGEGTRIHAFSHLENANVAKHAVIGPYARLRPGTQIADQAHIGNFVEIKNSKVGVGSKANHLSYIGDAEVGSGVNIGAGTITCNYDGVNKHQTIIEDNAFIGSDSQLVAPVRVGKGATLGAGTTLTKDAPPEQLTVSRPKQISVNWQRPEKIKK